MRRGRRATTIFAMADPPALTLDQVLADLYASEINARISWLWDGGIDVALGDQLSGYVAEANVATFAEAAQWLRDRAVEHFPESEFVRRHAPH